MKPFVEQVEDRQQLFLGGVGAVPGFRVDPGQRPALLAQVQELEHEIVLGGEVVVEGRLGDACASDDFVNADGLDAVASEQLVRRFEDPVARAGLGVASRPVVTAPNRSQQTGLSPIYVTVCLDCWKLWGSSACRTCLATLWRATHLTDRSV